MSRTWIIPWACAVAAGLVAYDFARHAACCGTAPGLDQLADVSLLAKELQLSDEQVREIQRLHTDLAVQLSDCCARHCAARARLSQALVADTNGTAQADAVVTDMCRAYEQSERATLEQIRQVRAVLNPEQRKRFDARVSDCVCQTCDMPGNKAPAGRMQHE